MNEKSRNAPGVFPEFVKAIFAFTLGRLLDAYFFLGSLSTQGGSPLWCMKQLGIVDKAIGVVIFSRIADGIFRAKLLGASQYKGC